MEKLKKCDKRENANNLIIFLLIAKKKERKKPRERGGDGKTSERDPVLK